MRVVVCDTGPVLHLLEAGALRLLQETGEVFIPPAVDRELGNRLHTWVNERPPWLQVRSSPSSPAGQPPDWMALASLGPGEAEAILLAHSIPADWFLTDDAGARVVAGLLGLEVHGSLGLVLWAAAAGRMGLEEGRSLLDRLGHSSLWITGAILAEAHRALDRLAS